MKLWIFGELQIICNIVQYRKAHINVSYSDLSDISYRRPISDINVFQNKMCSYDFLMLSCLNIHRDLYIPCLLHMISISMAMISDMYTVRGHFILQRHQTNNYHHVHITCFDSAYWQLKCEYMLWVTKHYYYFYT